MGLEPGHQSVATMKQIEQDDRLARCACPHPSPPWTPCAVERICAPDAAARRADVNGRSARPTRHIQRPSSWPSGTPAAREPQAAEAPLRATRNRSRRVRSTACAPFSMFDQLPNATASSHLVHYRLPNTSTSQTSWIRKDAVRDNQRYNRQYTAHAFDHRHTRLG
jgi:hypothetical protein